MSASGLAVWPEPGRFLVAESVCGELTEVRLRRLVQVQVRGSVHLDRGDIPALGLNAMHFGSCLVSAGLGRVASAVGSVAEGEELAVR